MKNIKLRLFFNLFSLSCLKKCLILNKEEKIIIRKLASSSGSSSSGSSSSGSSSSSSSSGSSSSSSSSGSSSSKPNNNQDEDEKKYEDCKEMIAYEPTDCFEIELDFKKNIRKCCFLEYKDKGYNNKRRRRCTLLTNDEFLDIKKKIKSIQENNKNYTVLSLECDKSNILSLNNALLLILLLFPF